jgi:hypothetical protein
MLDLRKSGKGDGIKEAGKSGGNYSFLLCKGVGVRT